MSDGKPSAESAVETAHIVMPSDANGYGTAFGGMVMQWIDLTAGMAAMRHTRLPTVTASVDQLNFGVPIHVGDFAILKAQVNAVFGSSLEVEVDVFSEEPLSGVRRRCCDAFLTFVALDADGHPTRVPPLRCDTEEERRRADEARARREARLAQRTVAPRRG
jgi:acyl-CoA hydrolase